jgi:hypothetical protein
LGGSFAFHLFFACTFDHRKSHNILVMMFDPWFKSLRLVFGYLGHGIVVVVVVEYVGELLLPLFMWAPKLLMLNKVEIPKDFES